MAIMHLVVFTERKRLCSLFQSKARIPRKATARQCA